MGKWRTSVGKEVIFRSCVACSKQTEGLCHCGAAICWQHMKAHLESCEAAKAKLTIDAAAYRRTLTP